MKAIVAVSLTAVAVAGLSGCTAASQQAPSSLVATARQCAGFDASVLGAGNATAHWVEATTALPAFCEVSGVVSPV